MAVGFSLQTLFDESKRINNSCLYLSRILALPCLRWIDSRFYFIFLHAMATFTQQIIQFATSLPPSTNPYEATAAKIGEETQTAELVLWGAILRRIIAFNYIMLCLQAIVALWLRKRAGKLHFFRFNKLGLIHVEVLNEIVLLMLIFSMLAAVDLATEELAERHLIRFSSKMVLHTCKFSFAAAVCWLFLWILGIEATLNLTSLGTRARAGATIKFSPYARFALNGSLLAVLAVPAIIILWISIVRSTIVGAIEATSEEVIANLLQRAPTYSPENYNPSSLLEILKPTESITPNSRRLGYTTKIMLYVYLAQHLFISAIYLPTWIIVSRRLAQEAVPADQLTGISSTNSPISDHCNALLRVRRRVIKHGFLIILEEVLYLPPLVYMLFFFKGPRFYTDPNFLLIDNLALHGPSAITGNIIMAFSIQNAFYTLQKSKNSAEGETKVSLSPDPEKANIDDSPIESPKC